jgi:hypothetical protein
VVKVVLSAGSSTVTKFDIISKSLISREGSMGNQVASTDSLCEFKEARKNPGGRKLWLMAIRQIEYRQKEFSWQL